MGAWACALALGLLGGLWIWAAQGSQWWAAALRSRLFIECGLLLMGCTLALVVVLRAMFRLGHAARATRPRLHEDRRGVAVLEFALLFPIALTITLVMIQTSLLMAGNLLVHYAAYAAARSAAVWVPADFPTGDHQDLFPYTVPDNNAGCHRNKMNAEKTLRVQRAAVLAVVPVAGAAVNSGGSGQAMANTDLMRQGLAGLYRAYSVPPPGWLGKELARKYEYAEGHTRVEVAGPANGVSYGPREDIHVTVSHDFYLSVPYANRIFEDGDKSGLGITEIKATCTLTNQGRDDRVEIETFPDSHDPLFPR